MRKTTKPDNFLKDNYCYENAYSKITDYQKYGKDMEP